MTPSPLSTALNWMGDSRLLVPVMLVLGGLWWGRNPRLAVAWAAALVALSGAIVVSKLAYKAFGVDWRSVGFFTISGHSALAAMLYPVLGYLLAAHAAPTTRLLSTLIGVALAVAVAVARVLSFRHTPAEIVVGLGLGLAASGWMLGRWRAQLALPPHAAPWVVGTAMVAGLAVWLVPNVPAERVLSHIAWRIRG
ncbi:phosphatase PAP2 family protein [Pseudoxanthomonas winnipegensis]|uniref:Phosphatase PAP2 family protein n=1 Tax=Pseudoxanthomonas winnipegensis TaxID=2480810 RepID=A0A4Q8LW37_9GAMM|nr:phosphatase PAP2 family protein [Pseudoxanthomonas winnipegensis]TAA36237.1 phosphatase PAP2 family protein [Pseudoxanthomonas winnipegensis]